MATTSGAATSAASADWKPLRGRTARIWPDNDDPGKAYAGEVASILLGMDCAVSCIDVDKLALGVGDDVREWLAANPGAAVGDIEALPMLTSCRAEKNATAGYADTAWPEPEPLAVKVKAEPYPIDALPEIIRKAVEEVAAFVKAPLPLVVASALATLSLAIQAQVDARRADKLSGRVGLFLLTIADSGERKSTCDEFFTKPIREYEQAQAEAAKPHQKKYAAEFAAWKAECEGATSAIREAAKGKKGKSIDTLLTLTGY